MCNVILGNNAIKEQEVSISMKMENIKSRNIILRGIFKY
jgi:hypothetical protein